MKKRSASNKAADPLSSWAEGTAKSAIVQLIEYTTGAAGRRLGLFLHHTDGDREFAYDRKSYVGTLDKALGQAEANGWIIVDMKNDWKRVFAFEGVE